MAALAVEFRLAVAGAPLLAIPLLGIVIAAACFGVPAGVEWYFRASRLAELDRDHAGGRGGKGDLKEGFPRAVDHRIQYYSVKYAPKGANMDRWLVETRGLRSSLRDEIIRLYEHDGCQVNMIAWLIRYHLSDIARRWQNDTLLDYQQRFQTPRPIRTRCYSTLALALASVAALILLAVSVDRVLATLCIPLVGGAGWYALTAIVSRSGTRRATSDRRRELAMILADRRAAFVKWRKKLEDRPNEHQMERWLDADKVLFLDHVMRVYQLEWREIIAHAVLQSPAPSSTRARVNNGPWRYSKYELRVFLITDRGVREIGTQLDFRRVTHDREERSTFRFDAFSSVQVKVGAGAAYYLDLTLTNGPTRSIHVVDSEPDSIESPEELSLLSLDAAGFVHALRILEGIAAEGKRWISRESARSRNSHSIGNSDNN